METLFKRHDIYLANTPMTIVRDIMHEINWNSRLVAIVGARGVGKSTLIRQFIRINFGQYDRSVLYCSLDSVYFSTHSFIDLAEQFVMNGGKRLFLDEVHKYNGWSKEIKEIYDLYPELKIVISGSSLLEILNAVGYYPFYLEGKEEYYTRIEQVVNFIIEVELPQLRKVDVSNIRKLKALVSIIASDVPYEVDASKLSRMIGAGRDTVIEYMRHLADAAVFNLLYSDVRSVGKLTRPDKIYLENPNLLYALSTSDVLIGTARETFVVSQLAPEHIVEYGRQHGDFKVDGKYTFEVGGKDKTFSQIAGVGNSFVLSDDIESSLGRKLPIWIVGFLK